MSNNTESAVGDLVAAADVVSQVDAGEHAIARRRSLRERGLATVEYAIAVVLVITMVGLLITSIQQGWFDEATQKVVKLLLDLISTALQSHGK